MKKIVVLLLLAVGISVFGQDVIYRSQADSINVKIVTVSDEEITYRLADYDEGPLFSLKTKEIVAIRYGNGMKQYFAADLPSLKASTTPMPDPKANQSFTS